MSAEMFWDAPVGKPHLNRTRAAGLFAGMLLSLVLLLIPTRFVGQVLTGRVRDLANGKPLSHVTVIVPGGTRGTITDSIGRFTMALSDAIELTLIGYGRHRIFNCAARAGEYDLGDIGLVFCGSDAYVMFEKRQLLSKKPKRVCKRVDDRKKVRPQDLIVSCTDGEVNYTWAMTDEQSFEVNAVNMNHCGSR